MKLVVLASRSGFLTEETLHQYIWPRYSEDGDCMPSGFMRDVGLRSFEPGAIEIIWNSGAQTLASLLEGASYYDQWAPSLPAIDSVRAAILVFSPNALDRPNGSRFEYVHEIELRNEK